jgi:hypothetical protein
MSSTIVREALWRVTQWGIAEQLRKHYGKNLPARQSARSGLARKWSNDHEGSSRPESLPGLRAVRLPDVGLALRTQMPELPRWLLRHGRDGVRVCFAAPALAAIAFVYWFLPEIKSLPIEEIWSRK